MILFHCSFPTGDYSDERFCSKYSLFLLFEDFYFWSSWLFSFHFFVSIVQNFIDWRLKKAQFLMFYWILLIHSLSFVPHTKIIHTFSTHTFCIFKNEQKRNYLKSWRWRRSGQSVSFEYVPMWKWTMHW